MGASVSMWFNRNLFIKSITCASRRSVTRGPERLLACDIGENTVKTGNPAIQPWKKHTEGRCVSFLRNGQKQKPCPEDSEICPVRVQSLCEVSIFSLRCQICPSKGPWAARIFEGPGWSCKDSSDWLFFIFPPKASHINAFNTFNALVYHCLSLCIVVYHFSPATRASPYSEGRADAMSAISFRCGALDRSIGSISSIPSSTCRRSSGSCSVTDTGPPQRKERRCRCRNNLGQNVKSEPYP